MMICYIPEALAQERQLVIKESTTNVSIAPYIAMIQDPKSVMTANEVIKLYEDQREKRRFFSNEKLGFGPDGSPSWLLLNIRNESDKEEFIFSLSQSMFKSQGTIENMVLYGAESLGKDTAIKIEQPNFKIVIPKNQDIRILVYIDPSDFFPLVLTPSISTQEQFYMIEGARQDKMQAFLFLALGVGLSVFLTFSLNNIRYVPYFITYCLYIVFVTLSVKPLISEGFGQVFYMLIIFLIMTAAALGTFLQNKITFKDKSELLSVGLPFSLIIIAGIILSFLPESFGLMNIVLILVPGVLFCLSFIILSIAFFQDGYKSSLWNCLSWIMIALCLITMMSSGFYLLLDITFIPVGLPYTAISAAMIFLFVSMVTTPNDIQKKSFADISVLPTSIKELKNAEEEGEYNRLLTVVERERQMMAELRQIDIRRRKDMQMAKESADEANRAKSAFLAVISHEIRTPMTGIMGLIRLLMDTPLSSDQKKYARSIMESGESMTMLLNDILDFEKIETGKMSLEKTLFDVKNVVQSTATLMAGHAQNKDIYLDLEIAPDVPLTFQGDPSRLRQVLLNLLGNAIKFTEKGGVIIKINDGNRLEDAETGEGAVDVIAIIIEDTGIGIAADAIEDLFNPFSQADRSIAGKYGGSGLGLAICQRLIELMGGDISVESEQGKGSRFIINLPVIAESRTTEYEKLNYTKVTSENTDVRLDIETPDDPTEDEDENKFSYVNKYEDQIVENSAGLTIMVVEDNLVSQQVIEAFLKKQGHQVTACDNAEDAMILLKDQTYDVVFMDWELPGMSGPEAIKIMYDDPEYSIKKAVLLTGHRVSVEETGLTNAQLAAILNKPVMPEDLERVISEFEFEEEASAPPAAPPSSPREAPPSLDKVVEKNFSSEDKAPLLKQLEEIERLAKKDEPVKPAADEKSRENDVPPQQKTETVWREDIFDKPMITSLVDTLGEPKVRELLENVFEKTGEILTDLDVSLQGGDLHEVNLRAHELKGMAGNFALSYIHDLAAALEKDIKFEDGKKAPDLLEKIQRAYSDAKQSIA